jgi:phi13 family phage major tail protein
MNKIKYGLKNAHYALITNTDGAIAYGTPKPIPGAVSLSLSPKGDKVEFPADDIMYFVASANQGYEGSAEFALLNDVFRKDILGDKEDANGVLFEDSNEIPKEFALLFEFTGDANATRHVLYNVSIARPNIESTTKGTSIEVKTDSFDITASPAIDTGYVKAKAEAGSAQYNTWFDAVYTYTATP